MDVNFYRVKLETYWLNQFIDGESCCKPLNLSYYPYSNEGRSIFVCPTPKDSALYW